VKLRGFRTGWLLSSWVHLALIAVIALEVAFIWWGTTIIMPLFGQFRHSGLLHGNAQTHEILVSLYGELSEMAQIAKAIGNDWILWAIGLAVVWGFFEWRVRSDSKHLIRLTALGTTTFALMVVVISMASAFVLTTSISLSTMRASQIEKSG
jgi:hypothetical protein